MIQEMVRAHESGKTIEEMSSQYALPHKQLRHLLLKFYSDNGFSAKRLKDVPALKGIISPRRAFNGQKNCARRRGIAWEFSFDQWWDVWQESGHWAQRGTNGYVMCRKGDVGPYSVGNVFIATARFNSSNSPSKKSGLPMGVKRSHNKFTAIRSVEGEKIYLGIYSTVEQAHAAYLSALGEGALI